MFALILCRVAGITGAVVLAGAASFRWIAGGKVPVSRAERGLAAASAAVVLIAEMARLWLSTAEMSGQRPTAALLWRMMIGTRFGHGWAVRMTALAVLGGWMLAGSGWDFQRSSGGINAKSGRLRRTCTNGARRSPSTSSPRCAVLVMATAAAISVMLPALVLVSAQWSSHAAALEQGVWLLAANVLHVLAAGVWPGGLPFLGLTLWKLRHEPEMRPEVVRLARRFSTASVVAVGGLTATGLLNAWGLVGTLTALTSSFYGRVLLLKVTIFVGMIGLGFLNRRMVWRLRADSGEAAGNLPTLWRNVVIECGLAVAVLTATEILASSAPPT